MFRKRWKPKTEPDEPVEIKDVEKARQRTMNRAVAFLAAKPRSVNELRERLLEKQWTNAEIVDAVLEKLKEYGYLDDAQFARNFAASKLRQKAVGKRRLQQTLQQKQLDKETVEAALEQVFEETPEEELIELAIKKRTGIRGLPKDRDETKKLFDYLLRQGFGFELVRNKLREIKIEAAEEFEEQ